LRPREHRTNDRRRCGESFERAADLLPVAEIAKCVEQIRTAHDGAECRVERPAPVG
jgi:hypothetical protein